MRKRLLAIHVFAQRHSVCSNGGMSVVGGGNEHTIDAVLHFVEHHTPVLEALCLGEVAKGLGCIVPVNVAQRHDILGLHESEVASSHAAYADTGDVHLVARCHVAESLAQHGVRHHHKRRCSHAAALQKVSSRNLLHLFLVLVLFYAPDGRPAPPGGVVSPKLAVLIHTSPHFVEKKSSLPHFPHASPQEKPVA